jgi:polar amino acid transport system substrate-binding protein
LSRSRLISYGLSCVLALAVAGVIPLAGCGQPGYTVNAGKLTVGTMSDATPFEFMESTKITGFDIDMGREIAKRLGLKHNPVTDKWNTLIPNLKARKYDVVMAAMTITFDRQKTLDFSSPYFKTDQSIVVTKSSPITNGNQLNGKVVGVLNDSTPQYAAEKIPGLKEIKKYDTVSQVYAALNSGATDAMIMDYSISEYNGRKSGTTKVIARIVTDEQYGIAMNKGNATLVKNVDSALKEIKSDGTYDRLVKKWFGSTSQSEG